MKLEDSMRQQVRSSTNNILSRLRFTHPFPLPVDVSPYPIFMDLIPVGIKLRMQDVLEAEAHAGVLLTRTDHTHLFVDSGDTVQSAIVARFKELVAAPPANYSKLTIRRNHPALDDIRKWRDEALRIDEGIALVGRVVSKVMYVSNTTGQATRLFPEVAMLMGNKHAGKVRSPEPRYMSDHNREFIVGNRDRAAFLLTKALLAPEQPSRFPKFWVA